MSIPSLAAQLAHMVKGLHLGNPMLDGRCGAALQEVFPTRSHLAVVMEYASGGDLSQLIEDTLRTTVRCTPRS